MKTIPAALQAHLDTGATTLCRCWKVTRTDAVVKGFTDHDVAVTFGGTTFEASSGFTASEVQKTLGLSIDNLTVAGALSSASLNETDLAAGKYDNANVEIYIVNWADVAQRVLVHEGPVGEVSRGRSAFQTELLGLAKHLNQEVGKAFGFSCDADLGDARCAISLSNPLYFGVGTVGSVTDPRRLVVTGLAAFADDWFSLGKVLWTSGPNSGRAIEVKRHVKTASQVRIELWQPMSETVAAGHVFTVTAGCDKQFATCKAKFANHLNFRGFPYMIGNDALMSAARTVEKLDGSSRYGN